MLVYSKAVRPNKSNGSPTEQLSPKEKKTFESLIQYIDHAQKNKQINLVYRGESKANLRKKLSEDYGTYKFFERLFFVGEKAKHFFQQSTVSLNARNYLKSINDASDETFDFIFESLDEILTTEELPNSPNKAKAIKEFRESQLKFTDFFTKKENLIKFREKLSQVKIEYQIQIRDYYLYLLHTYGLKNNSFFVSTSTDEKVAKHFAIEGDKKKKRAVIIHYFFPEKVPQYGVSISSNQRVNSLCEELGLPVYSNNFYPAQNEVSIKGALFPHFILGICDLEDEYFIVNPHIFKQSEEYLKWVPQQGFIIDQRNFEEEIKKTRYAGYVMRGNRTDTYSDDFHF